MRIVDDINEEDERADDKNGPRRPRNIDAKNYERIEADKDGFVKVDKKNQKNRKKYIRNQLRSNNCMSVEEANDVVDIWKLNEHNRWRLYRLWVRQYTLSLEDQIKEYRRQINAQWQRFEALGHQMDIELIRGFDVIGMTTTGAAKYHHLIDGIKPHIVSKYTHIHRFMDLHIHLSEFKSTC